MKRIIFLLIILLISHTVVTAQKVDSIKVEQSGDFIKIGYRILGSTPRQIYRVTVLFSLDGGLNQEPKTISGDIGDYVMGGKPEYWVLWDVLKDVPEIKSVEFVIRAELIKDMDAVLNQGTTGLQPKWWQRNNFIGLVSFSVPGPKYGIRFGYLGNFGFSAQLVFGKIPVTAEYINNKYFYEPPKKPAFGFDLTKRIINKEKFKLHLIAGVKNTDLMVYFAGATSATPQFWRQGMTGGEAGLVIAYERIVTSVMFSRLNPKQLNKLAEDVTLASPYKFIDVGLGFKF